MLTDPETPLVTREVSAPHAVGVRRTRAGTAADLTLPRWFKVALIGALVWCSVAGSGGAVLLFLERYNAAIVVIVATVCSLGAAAASVASRAVPGGRPAHGAAAAAVAIAVALGVLAGAFHSEHLLVDRDPAVYLNTGRSIARTHELRPRVAVGEFADAERFSTTSPSLGNKDGRLQPGFFHMLPVLLALGWSAGGDEGMLLVPAVLGALGLLALFALASRVVGPRWALAVVGVLALAPLQLWFARDAYSELLVQFLVLGGLWLFLEARRGPVWQAAIAGAVIASSVFARIDSVLLVSAAFVVAALDWPRRTRAPAPRGTRGAVPAFAAALLVTTGIGLLVTRRLSEGYIDQLAGEYRQLLAGLAVAIVAGVVLVAMPRWWPAFAGRVAQSKLVFGVVALAVAAICVWAWTWRIDDRSELPTLERGEVATKAVRQSINEWHWRWSLRWFAEYFGVVAVALAVIGMLVLLWRALRGHRAATAVLLVAVPVAVFFIARPNITADQPWAMRRYAAVVLPGIAIAIAVALSACWNLRRPHSAVWRAATLGLALAVAIPSSVAAAPFVTARTQDGALQAVRDLCDAAGPDAAVLILPGKLLDLELPATMQAFCGVPSAKLRAGREIDLAAFARDWQRAGRRLVVATASPGVVEDSGVAFRRLAHVVIRDRYSPVRSYGHRPKRAGPRPRQIWLYAITPAATPAGTPVGGGTPEPG